MGLLLKINFVNDKTYQIPLSECYVRIENYLIRKNPSFLDLTIRYWQSKEIADLNTRKLNTSPTPLQGVLDPYLIIDEQFVKLPNRFSIPLISTIDGVENYDVTILENIYQQSYDYLKIELKNQINNILIEDL